MKQTERMSGSKMNPDKKETPIQCIEILVSKKYLQNNHNNLHWTLSVYSLENQPVTKDRSLHNSEIFHFMVFDWKRTIKQLLDKFQVPYSIIQYFSPDTVHADALNVDRFLSDNETDFLLALNELEPNANISTVASEKSDALRIGKQTLSLEHNSR
ncbi:MAG: hypothetical protein WA874_02475 [Chryseosolibacter sp.]